MRVAEYALKNAVTAMTVIRQIGYGTSGDYRFHPLMLPLHERASQLHDFSRVTIGMPLELRRGKRGTAEKLLEPLARLCAENKGEVPYGEWLYDWYYLELLDHEDRLKPSFWISPSLLDTEL